MNRALWKAPFACRMFSKAGCGRRQGSAMNSLRSALTAVLAGQTQPQMQAKGGFASRLCTSDILTIELVQNIGQVTPKSLKGLKCYLGLFLRVGRSPLP